MPSSKGSSVPSSEIESSDISRIARGAGVNIAGTVLKAGLGFGLSILVARVLSTSELGLYTMGTALALLAVIVCSFGLDMGLWRYISSYRAQGSDEKLRGALHGSMYVALPASILVALLLSIFATQISHMIFENDSFAFPLRAFSLTIPLLVSARMFNAVTQGLQIMRYAALRDVVEQALRLFFTASLFLLGLRLSGALYANIAAVFFITILSFYFMERVYPIARARTKAHLQIGTLLKYSAPLGASLILSYLLVYMDTILLGYFRTSDDVGLYSVVIRIIVIAAIVQTSFSTMFAPVISDLYERGKQKNLAQLFTKITRWTIMLSLPIFLPLFLFPSGLLSIFGPQFVVVSGSLIIVAVGQLMNAATGPVAVMIAMSGRSVLELTNSVLSWTISLILCVLLIPRIGTPGAAIANASAAGASNIIRTLEVYLIMGVHPYNWKYLKIVLAGVAASLLAYAGYHYLQIGPDVLSLIVWCFVLIASYGAIIFILGLEEEDSEVLHQFRARLTRTSP